MAIVGTKTVGTELAGGYKIVTVTATVGTADDSITLTEAVHGIKAITAIVSVVPTKGLDDGWTWHTTSFSGLVLTLVSHEEAGGAADEFTTTEVSVTVIGTA
jgi:hypothetical protein